MGRRTGRWWRRRWRWRWWRRWRWGGAPDTGSLYSDLVVALRAADGTPILTEYTVTGEEGVSLEYCVQPVSYTAVPGVTPITNPLDGRQVWVLPLQGQWIDNPVDPLPVEEIEPCDPMPQYAMFVAEAELERLNLTRTSDDVLAKKLVDVQTKLTLAHDIGLDPAGRLTADGAALDAAPEYAAIYKSLMTTGALPGLAAGDIPYSTWQLAAVAVGTAASKTVPLTVDSVQYYNRAVGFTTDPLPSWGDLAFIRSADPDPTTPMPSDTLPGGENFVDYSGFSYNRGDTFVGQRDVARRRDPHLARDPHPRRGRVDEPRGHRRAQHGSGQPPHPDGRHGLRPDGRRHACRHRLPP